MSKRMERESTSPEIRWHFRVEGDELDPEEFTRLVGIQPIAYGKKGEPSPHPSLQKLGHTIPETFWEIKITRNSYSTDEGMQELWGLIWEKREAIVEYLQGRPEVHIGVLVGVTIYEDRPVYELSPDTIKKLAYLGAKFVMDDIYDLRKE